jgi:hypothetical protein
MIISEKMPSTGWDIMEKIFEIFFLMRGNADSNDLSPSHCIKMFRLVGCDKNIGHEFLASTMKR